MTKPSAKMVLYGVWLVLVAWLSMFGGGTFSGVVDAVGKKLFPGELLPGYADEIDFMLWTGFVCLLGWLPVLFRRDHWTAAIQAIGRDITFIILLTGSMIFGAIFWEMVFQDDYTPSVFVSPADMVNAGWGHFPAWCVWWGFIIVVNTYSALAAGSLWKSRNAAETIEALMS